MLEATALAVTGLLLGMLAVGLSRLYDKMNQLETDLHLMRMERDRFQEGVTDVLIEAAGEGDVLPRYAESVVERITDAELRGLQRSYLNRALKRPGPQKEIDDA